MKKLWFKRSTPEERAQKMAQEALAQLDGQACTRYQWFQRCSSGYLSLSKQIRFENAWLRAGRERWPDMPENLAIIMGSPELAEKFHFVYPQPEIPLSLVRRVTEQYAPAPKTDQMVHIPPYAYTVELTTHQMLYQDVVVESEIPLPRSAIVEKALEQAGDEWEPGPRDKNPDIDGVKTIRAPGNGGKI